MLHVVSMFSSFMISERIFDGVFGITLITGIFRYVNFITIILLFLNFILLIVLEMIII